MKIDDYKLCYINSQEQLVFTDNFEYQDGINWSDSFWIDNSGDPYEAHPIMDKEFNKDRGNLIFVGIKLPYAADLPPDYLSVHDINSGDFPWISMHNGKLYPGTTYKDAKKLLKKMSIPHALFTPEKKENGQE